MTAEHTELTRRRFVQGAAVAGAVALTPRSAHARPRRQTVAVLGGGVAGLSAAHELAERGFAVTVYEQRAFGGKARSTEVPHSARGARRPLPGEHGFRFFPGFYQNLPDTMKRIPFPGNRHGVFDNLVAAPLLSFARDGGREDVLLPTALDDRLESPQQFGASLVAALELATGLPANEVEYFVQRLLVFMTSCDARRLGPWEHESWWEFTAAAHFSEDYRRLLVNGITRQILAAKGTVAGARTLGLLWEKWAFNVSGQDGGGSFDRLLNLPTNEAWIHPWTDHLRHLGVKLRLHHRAEGLHVRNGRIAGARIRTPHGVRNLHADWFVCALPAERARRLFGQEVRAADPRLARTDHLTTAWMNGIQFYLRRPTPIVHGHVLYIDSPWALSSVSQAQFWGRRDFARDYGDGRVHDCLSVDIGDWNERGIVNRRRARELSPERVAREVWAQMKAHLNDTGKPVLTDDNLHSWALDPGLVYRRRHPHAPLRPVSQDPLLINTPGGWDDRPDAETRLRNLVLASDYVRTDVDVACMEGANEAARRAVNVLLERGRSRAEACHIHTRYRSPGFEALRSADAVRFGLGQPNALDTGPPVP